ncbi:MAG: aquaporin family protein [Saprospiraceae bacterium]|nr:aquaporin family protein [Saprospiraceae bacterium]
MQAYIAEFLGTAILILIGNGVCAGANLKKTHSNDGGWIVITLAWGLGVTMGVYVSGQYSDAHINPAVTLAAAISGTFAWSEGPGYIIAQFLGAMVGASLTWVHYLPHWKETEDQEDKLGSFATAGAINRPFANLLSEVIGTMVLIFGLLSIGLNDFADGLNPFVVGLLIVVIGMALGGTTGYAINPARDLGPRLMHALLPIAGKGSSDWSYAWIPIVGPLIGGVSGAAIFYLYTEGQINIWLLIGFGLSLVVLLAALSENRATTKT